MTTAPETIVAAAVGVLCATSVDDKCARAAAAASLNPKITAVFAAADPIAPIRPARPGQPQLLRPQDVPKRKLGSPEGRLALLHAITHIEFNAINLAFDMLARFASEIADLGLDSEAFAADWLKVGGDETRHFGLLNRRLRALGSSYGAFPAHDGLWDVAVSTHENLLARLVVAPLILEARGLDVTPQMIDKLEAAGDFPSADVLQTIYVEEIAHVATGERWFHAICMAESLDPEATFHALQSQFFPAGPRPPFNHEARALAGLPRQYYDRA